MAAIPEVAKLSPDGFSRFYILVDLISQLYKGRTQPISILDVGGGSPFFEQQMHRSGLAYDLTVIDILPPPENVSWKYIQGDATAMTFEDASFDVVISTDVLEHIPETGKQAFLNECLRVAKDACIIAAPFMTPETDAAERVTNEFNKQLFGTGQDWLEEHLALGKPRHEMFAKTLKKQQLTHHDFGTQNMSVWLMNTHTNLIDAKLGLDTAAHVKANRFYNENILAMNEFEAPTYRHFYVMYKQSALASKIDSKKYAPGAADASKVAAYTTMMYGLFMGRIEALKTDLEAAQTKTVTLERLNDEQNQQLAERNEESAQQKLVIQDQAAQLQRLEPVLRVVHNRHVRKVVSAVRKVKG